MIDRFTPQTVYLTTQEREARNKARNSVKATSNQQEREAEIRAAKQRSKEAKHTYGRGKEISVNRIQDKKLRTNLKSLENKYKDTVFKARDAEILHENQAGLLEPEHELEKTWRTRQDDLQKDLPLQTAKKGFELKLKELGPYVAEYTRNGRELLLAGKKGHIASMDWRSGKLGCEIQLGETIKDVKWLHNNQYFAAAQRQSVYIYDHQGVEIHCLKKLLNVTHLDYLPYHFLLASIGTAGVLKYLDSSTGQIVAEMPTKQGAATAFAQNPYNAIMHVGHQNGTVDLWSPNSSAYQARLKVHNGPVRALAVDREGRYMITAGQESKMAIWDLRMFKDLHKYSLTQPGTDVAISDRGLTSVAFGTRVSIWQGLFDKSKEDQDRLQRPYMTWGGEGQRVERVRWCPLEDVLGVSHHEGFSNIIVPGAGEPNFDALEVNPYENVKQRQESEVRGLLNKLQPDTISMNPNFIGNLDLTSAEERKREKDKDINSKDVVDLLKNRGRGKNSALRKYLRKRGSKNVIDEKRLKVQEAYEAQRQNTKGRVEKQRVEFGPALARFAR
ncbi:MAG: hypothetical protein Q9162_000961 [Coniocarpon cinnabarinum]